MDTARKRTVGIIALIALIACLVAWLVNASKSARPIDADPVALDHARDADTTALDSSGSKANERARVDPAARQSSVDEPVVHDPSLATQEILVVLLGAGTPVVGADVRCASLSDTAASYDPSRPLHFPDIEQLLAGTAALQSDSNGIVRVDERAVPGLVCARLGDLYGGRTVYEHTDGPIRIEISADITFSVQVVDERGTPVAGAPVSVRASKGLSKGNDVITQTTEGPQGIARIAHLQSRFARQSGTWTLGAHLALVGYEGPLVPIDIDSPPADPVQLVLPRTGSVTVLVHDSEQRGVKSDGVNLVATSQLGADGNVPWLAHAFGPEINEAGRVVYAFVPLGLDLALEVFGNGTIGHVRGAGPHVAGEQVTFEVDLGPAVPEIVGRLVDERAQPIRDCDGGADWRLFASGSDRATGGRPLRTDADGRFRLPLPVPFEESLGGTLRFRPYGAGYGHGEQALVDLDGKIHAGRTDLGDVVVRDPIVLASGRVLDDLGAPVPKALIGGDELVLDKGTEKWRSSSLLGGHCDASGAFTLKGSPGLGPFRLRAACSGYVEDTTARLESGASGISIVLTRASGIAGKLLLDDFDADARITVRVRTSGGTAEDRRLRYRESTTVKTDGAFELSGLRPGRVDLEIELSGRSRPLRVIDGIVLSPGETSSDARLASIDLRGALSAPDPVGEPPR